MSSRLSIVAALIAALCIAPATFAKPKDNQQGAGGGGKKGKGKGQAASGAATVAPGGTQPIAPGGTQTQRSRGAQTQGSGGLGIVIIPPFPPPPYYRRSYPRYSDSSDSTVVSVQRALKSQGYYTGPVDGDAGSGTRAAIRGFREDKGMEVSSNIDSSLLRALGL